MEEALRSLLPKIVEPGFAIPNTWHIEPLTQGNAHNTLEIISIRDKRSDLVSVIQDAEDTSGKQKDTPEKRSKRDQNTKQFVDVFAAKVDEMFHIYPFETKRDIRIHLRERLIDWVSRHARGFFGPSTSRAISACLRGQGIVMADVERFAEFVSFLFDGPVKAGIKTVVWHGYTDTTRDPVCELVMKPQGVFVSNYKN